MNTENFAVDECSENEEVKDLSASFPDRGIPVFLLAFFIESIDLGDLAGLMVAANKCDTIRPAAVK